MFFSHTYTHGFIRAALLFFVVVFGVVYVGYRGYILPPRDFPRPAVIKIESGQTLFSISQELYEHNIIRSPRAFKVMMRVLGSDTQVSEGEYHFTKPTDVFGVALRISGKQFGIEKSKVTFPEGFSNKEMAARLQKVFPDFDTGSFIALSKDKEGYLFPETYRFFPTPTPAVVIKALQDTYTEKLAPLQVDIAASGHTEKEILTMASLIEKEARGSSDPATSNERAIVAGILWKRLERNIPLQVDAPFLFLLGKESKDLTRADLAINSPYNTYTNRGLPPTPINNPGLAAITAALYPIPSPYLYYLHDAYGTIHYASTYEEHKKNSAQYLQ